MLSNSTVCFSIVRKSNFARTAFRPQLSTAVTAARPFKGFLLLESLAPIGVRGPFG